MAVNLANDRPLVGGGFEAFTESAFHKYAPDPSDVHAAHSIYFQILGDHGYAGLALFLLLWILVWRDASWIIRYSRSQRELKWAFDLARLTQVSLVGYFVGGAFLSLAYYDVPYNLVVVLVLTRVLVEKEVRSLQQQEGAPVRPQVNVGEGGGPRASAGTRFDTQMSPDKRG
jgi:probable O-glycosylation ligase (exosortase A-associated)